MVSHCRTAVRGDLELTSTVDAGKSTMLGVLVKGGLDDGRGKARVNLFRHKHEIESGRTSSVGMEIMGFDSKGEIVTSNTAGRKLTWEEIGRRSVSISSNLTRPNEEYYEALLLPKPLMIVECMPHDTDFHRPK